MRTDETVGGKPEGTGGRQTGGWAGRWKALAWVTLVAAMEASLPLESHFMHGADFRERAVCGVVVFGGLVACGVVLRFVGE